MSLPNFHLLRGKRERAGGNHPGDHQISLGGLKVQCATHCTTEPGLGGPRVGAEGFEVASLRGWCLQHMHIPDLLCVHPVQLNADHSVVQLWSSHSRNVHVESGSSAKAKGEHVETF